MNCTIEPRNNTERRQNKTHRTQTYIATCTQKRVQKLSLYFFKCLKKAYCTQIRGGIFNRRCVASQGQHLDWNRRTDSHMRASECPNWTSTHLHHTADHDTPACLDGETSTVLRKVSEQGIGIKRETHSRRTRSRRTPDIHTSETLSSGQHHIAPNICV